MAYVLLRSIFALSLRAFFRVADLRGVKRIPQTGPVLLVANHTNAFVDPLVILVNVRRRVTLTAKSTLRANPLLRLVIAGFGAVLFHRQGDVAEGARPSRNVDALARCKEILQAGGALVVFPEGVSHSDPAMRGFRTGAARIAADYTAATGRALTVVPIGLHYSRKDRWRSDAVGLVGRPVAVDAGEARDVRALTERMRAWVEALTLNFATAEERNLILLASRLFEYRWEGPEPIDRPESLEPEARIDRGQRLAEGAHALRRDDPERFAALASGAATLTRRLAVLGVEPPEVAISMSPARAALFVLRELEIFLVGAPLAALGWLVHLPPFLLTRRLVAALSADEDHPASNAVFLGPPIFLLWWAGVVAVAWIAASAGGAALAALALPLCGAIALRFRDRAGGAVRRARTFLLWLRRPELRERMAGAIEAWQDAVLEAEAEVAVGGAGTPRVTLAPVPAPDGRGRRDRNTPPPSAPA